MKTIKLFGNFELKAKKPFFNILLDHFLALLLPIAGYFLTIVVAPNLLDTTPTLIFFPLIALSAWNGGLTAGVLSTVTSAVTVNYYLSPTKSFITTPDPMRMIQFVLLVVEGTFISYIIEVGKRQEKIRDYKQKERELSKKVVELEEENKKYEKEIRSRDEFLSIASHELKTPLTSMLLQTQTALHNIRNVSVARFSFDNLLKMLESVENQTKRLSKMINDLLAVSVITIGNLNLEYEEIDLDKLVKGVLTDFSARIEHENYTIVYNPTEKVIGSWDKIRVEQAVSNFVSNAIKYGNHKPIIIKIRKNRNFAEISIKDQGIGITKQKQKRIFELFQRAVSPEEYKGLGVGLYITQKIVTAHGGSVDVSSRPNAGAQFTMKLPLKKPQSKLKEG